jgi:hypothetical protein
MQQRIGARSSIVSSLLLAILFVAASSVCWLIVNNFAISREDGFDPFRYEHLARSDLPEYLAESSSYKIVFLLKFIYQFLPEYYGYMALIAVFVTFVLLADHDKIFRVATLSPIGLYYFGQTGKDGMAILAFASTILIAKYGLRLKALPLTIVIALAVFIRPALLLMLPPLFMLFKFGFRWCIASAIALCLAFLISTDSQTMLSTLQDVVSDDSSGLLAQLGRELTFGYGATQIIGRSVLLFLSPFIQPFASIIKALISGETFIFFEGACLLAFFVYLIKARMMSRFLITSLPFVVLVATASPFYHFRYVAVLYPAILAYCLWQKQDTILNNTKIQLAKPNLLISTNLLLPKP